ncbi:MAG: AI-2E family transporter [bacterium]|nr:AI-2E family transporter [bacterium]
MAVNFFSWLAGTIGKSAIVLTLSVLFSIEKDAVIRFIAGIAGSKKREYLEIKVKKIYKKLGLWLKGQALLCLFVAIAVLLALLIMSLFGLTIPQKGSLAVIAGLTELVPYL